MTYDSLEKAYHKAIDGEYEPSMMVISINGLKYYLGKFGKSFEEIEEIINNIPSDNYVEDGVVVLGDGLW